MIARPPSAAKASAKKGCALSELKLRPPNQSRTEGGIKPLFRADPLGDGGLDRDVCSQGTRGALAAENNRWTPTLLIFLGILMVTPAAQAEYAVLRSGQRLHVTGYERLGPVVRLQMAGGSVEIPATDLLAIEPEEVFPPSQTPPLPVPYAELIRAAAVKHAMDEQLIASVIAVESNFDPRAVSPRQAQGLMQLRPETAARLGVRDVFDPQQNIDAGTRYLKELLARYRQNLALALAAYNAGPDRIEQYRGLPPFSETRAYVKRVTQRLKPHAPARDSRERHKAPAARAAP